MPSISTEQKQFLQTVANLAYGSGSGEASLGGKGHMALQTGQDGQLRVIKCNTHFNHAQKVQDEITKSTGSLAHRQGLIDGSNLLRSKLSEIGKSLGMGEQAINELLGSDQKTLLTRKVVAKFVTTAKNADAGGLLRDVWTSAKNNAVKSDFSMTFEKVAAKDATYFNGKFDLSRPEGIAATLDSLNKTLGLDDGSVFPDGKGNSILALHAKLSASPAELLTANEEADMHSLGELAEMMNVRNFNRPPFGKAAIHDALRQEFAKYGTQLDEADVGRFLAESDFRTNVSKFLQKPMPGSERPDVESVLASAVKNWTPAEMLKKYNAIRKDFNLIGSLLPMPEQVNPSSLGNDTSKLCHVMRLLQDANYCQQFGLQWVRYGRDALDEVKELMADGNRKIGCPLFLQKDVVELVKEEEEFANDVKNLLLGQPKQGLEHFEAIAKKAVHRQMLVKVIDDFKAATEGKNSDKIQAVLKFAESKDREDVEVTNRFKSACEFFNFDAKRYAVLHPNKSPSLSAGYLYYAQHILMVKNAIDGTDITLEFKRSFFSDDVLNQCSALAEQLKNDGLEGTAAKFQKLVDAVRKKDATTADYEELAKLVSRLKTAGLCPYPDIQLQVGEKIVTAGKFSVQQSVADYMERFPGLLSPEEREFLKPKLCKKLNHDVVDRLVMENGGGDIKTALDTAINSVDFRRYAFSLTLQTDLQIMEAVTGYENVLERLSVGKNVRSYVIPPDGTKVTHKIKENDTVVYEKINVHAGRMYGGHPYIHDEQSCMFHSTLHGLGCDVSRENALILRKALYCYVKDCMKKLDPNAKKAIKRGTVQNFCEKINPEFSKSESYASYVYLDAPSEMFADLKTILKSSTAMENGYVPFLASMLKRPINLTYVKDRSNDVSYQVLCDVDVMTGKKIESDQPPLTIMFRDGHYQSLVEEKKLNARPQ